MMMTSSAVPSFNIWAPLSHVSGSEEGLSAKSIFLVSRVSCFLREALSIYLEAKSARLEKTHRGGKTLSLLCVLVLAWAGPAASLWSTPCWRGWSTRSRWTFMVMWPACVLKGTTWCRQRSSTSSSTRPFLRLQHVASRRSLQETCMATSRSSAWALLEKPSLAWSWSSRWVTSLFAQSQGESVPFKTLKKINISASYA